MRKLCVKQDFVWFLSDCRMWCYTVVILSDTQLCADRSGGIKAGVSYWCLPCEAQALMWQYSCRAANHCVTPARRDCERERGIYQAALMDSGSLQSHCDAVEEDESQNHIVKELMSDDLLTPQTKPAERPAERQSVFYFVFLVYFSFEIVQILRLSDEILCC